MPLIKKDQKFKGEMLYHRRMTLGLTQQDIAKKIHCTGNAVHLWEMGKAKPQPKSLFNLAKTLGVPATYFFGKNNDEN